MDQADGAKVGEGRSEPNNSPVLPAPVGRMEFSLNPFKMLSQIFGKAFVAKMIGVLCCCACVAMCVAMVPLVISGVTSKVVENTLGL